MFNHYIPAYTLPDKRLVLLNPEKIVAIEQSPQLSLGKFFIRCGGDDLYYTNHVLVDFLFHQRCSELHQYQQGATK